MWNPKLPRGRRETHSLAIAKHDWLPLIGHRAVHDWTVAVALDMGTEALLRWVTPAYSTYLVTLHAPPGKAFKVFSEALRIFRQQEIYEGIA
jgi:hypothetical protein